MSHVMRADHYKVDVINMSYGEHSHWSHTGRMGQLMAEVVSKHGVSWVVSAGNDGPALCTVGTPPDICQNVMIGVGAYVSPEMMSAMYSSRDKLPGTQYTWTSRGPTIDGDRGVTVCAPGGAITSVPQFTLRGTQLMNGTSMAAPHVAGALAIILSGMRALKLPWSPFSVKRALENSSTLLDNQCVFGQGNGLLNVERAFQHLSSYCESMERDVRFAVHCNGNSSKGIHLRGLASNKVSEVPIKVEPVFLDSQNRPAKDKCDFNLRLVLSCPVSWVNHSDHLDLMYTARHFLISVDPTGLAPGAHSTFISAHDSKCPEKGKLFEIPITVIRTEQLSTGLKPGVSHQAIFNPGQIKRHFLAVPRGATWATFKAQSLSPDSPGKFVIHTVQLQSKLGVTNLEHQKMFNLAEHGEWEFAIPVNGRQEGNVVEFCLAKWWANLGNVEIKYNITFHGVQPSQREFVMHGGDGLMRVDLHAGISHEEISPEIKLKSTVQVLRPQESRVVTLGCRDILPPARHTYELQLQYAITIAKATEITVNLPLLSDVLYESEFESQMWHLYDSNKRMVGSGDAFPSNWSLKVEKGDYVLKVHVRQEKKELLDRFTDTPMLVSSKLSSAASLDVYSSHSEAIVGGKKMSMVSGYPGKEIPIYIAPLASEKYSKGATLGQFLQGTATFTKDEWGKKVDVYPFKYILPEAAKKKDKGKEKDGKGKDKGEDNQTAFKEAVRDTKITWLAKLPAGAQETKDLYSELCTAGETLTSVHNARLQGLNAAETKDWNEIISAANKVISSVNETELLAWLGTKADTRENAGEVKKEMEKLKGHLIDALAIKGDALLKIGGEKEKELGEVYSSIVKYCDPSDTKVVNFVVRYLTHINHHAKALKYVSKQMEEKHTKELDLQAVDLFNKLGWNHAASMMEKSLPAKFPVAYQPF